jgi:hypothetical protein
MRLVCLRVALDNRRLHLDIIPVKLEAVFSELKIILLITIHRLYCVVLHTLHFVLNLTEVAQSVKWKTAGWDSIQGSSRTCEADYLTGTVSLCGGQRGQSIKLTTDLQLLLRLQYAKLYLHLPIFLHCVALIRAHIDVFVLSFCALISCCCCCRRLFGGGGDFMHLFMGEAGGPSKTLATFNQTVWHYIIVNSNFQLVV